MAVSAASSASSCDANDPDRFTWNNPAVVPDGLTVDDAGVLRAWVRGGRLEARLTTSAAAVVAVAIVSEAGGRPLLRIAGRSYVIQPRSAT